VRHSLENSIIQEEPTSEEIHFLLSRLKKEKKVRQRRLLTFEQAEAEQIRQSLESQKDREKVEIEERRKRIHDNISRMKQERET
jgi:archaellum component FlaC